MSTQTDIRQPVAGGQALEMIMRDVMDGMEELSTMAGWAIAPGVMEILYIGPESRLPESRPERRRPPAPRVRPISPVPLFARMGQMQVAAAF